MEYDALNRVTSRTTPDLSVTVPSYNAGRLLEQVHVGVHNGPLKTVVHNIDYNARRQRLLYEYADPTATGTDVVTCQTAYTYDPLTFRPTHLVTTRVNGGSGNVILQDLFYTYDPIGNIVELDDASLFHTTVPSSNGFYVYDPLYRLIQATGREHPGQSGGQPGPDDALPVPIPSTSDLQALVGYNELYSYDAVGNILQMVHIAAQGATQWTRQYQYALDSNRLIATSRPGDPTGVFSDTAYEYTPNGALKRMPHLAVIDWDYADRMQHASRGPGDSVFFTYDNAGQRVRKVWEHGNNVDERIYLEGWETFRHHAGTTIGAAVTLERETLHVMDGMRRIATVETKTLDTSNGATGVGVLRWRFQLENQLGSSIFELDATGNVISYEEYHPFGTTAFRAEDGSVSSRRYRYTGKEKDEETGLYYYGARYYAPWLGRWTAADPSGLSDGPNVYAYVGNNPVNDVDPNGNEDKKSSFFANSAAFSYAPSEHDIFPTSRGVDTGSAVKDFGWNLLHSVNNLATIPFNAVTEAIGYTSDAARWAAKKVGMNDSDIEAVNFGLMMTGIGEVAMVPQALRGGLGLFRGAQELKAGGQEVNAVIKAGQELNAAVNTGQEVKAAVQTGQEVKAAVQTGQEVKAAVQTGQEVKAAVQTGQEAKQAVAVTQEAKAAAQTGQEVKQGAETAKEATKKAAAKTKKPSKAATEGPEHHLATAKNPVSKARGGPWTPRFEALFKKAGMTLEDALNKLRVPGHKGPHSQAYHEAVFRRLSTAVQGLEGEAYANALRAELTAIRTELGTPGSIMHNLLMRK